MNKVLTPKFSRLILNNVKQLYETGIKLIILRGSKKKVNKN
jgi:hypothetical protein